MMRPRLGTERIGGLILVSLLLAGCMPAPGRTGRPTPASGIPAGYRQSAEEMAAQWGVPADEAYRRLRVEDAIGTLQTELAEWEVDTFAGLWIENEPGYAVVAAFTRDGEKTLKPYLEDRSIPGLTVREARFTLAELEAMQAQASRELGKLDFQVGAMLSIQDNRVEVFVSDKEWFEAELERVGARLPEGVELAVVEGGSTAKDKELLLTPPVPGVAFPRQNPPEGMRTSMLAQLVGTLRLDSGCLFVDSLDGAALVPIWPPEFTLRAEGDGLVVIDGQGQVAARTGEEVYLGGGYVGVSDQWVLQQIPAACQGETFVVGSEARPNLRYDSDLFALDVVPAPGQEVLFLRYQPALDRQVEVGERLAGRLVTYDYARCLHLQTDTGPGQYTLFWPLGWSLRAGDGEAAVVDSAGQIVARVGDEVSLRGRPVPQDMEFAAYEQLVSELPGDCIGASWLVDGVE